MNPSVVFPAKVNATLYKVQTMKLSRSNVLSQQ